MFNRWFVLFHNLETLVSRKGVTEYEILRVFKNAHLSVYSDCTKIQREREREMADEEPVEAGRGSEAMARAANRKREVFRPRWRFRSTTWLMTTSKTPW